MWGWRVGVERCVRVVTSSTEFLMYKDDMKFLFFKNFMKSKGILYMCIHSDVLYLIIRLFCVQYKTPIAEACDYTLDKIKK